MAKDEENIDSKYKFLNTNTNFRKGWKIMTEDGESLDSNALRAVVGMIKDIEYQVRDEQIYNTVENVSLIPLIHIF